MSQKESNIIDDNFLDLESIKKKLTIAGILNFYEDENSKLIISINDAVRVELSIENNAVVTSKQFPQIGNTVQIIMTAILVILSFIFDLPFKWIIAISLGQLASYLYHRPKITTLENKIRSSVE